MPTSNNNINRQNGSKGGSASSRATHVARCLNKLIEGRVNGRSAVLSGVRVYRVGEGVTVAVGHLPGAEAWAAERGAELAQALLAEGFTLHVNPHSGHMLHLTNHPKWTDQSR